MSKPKFDITTYNPSFSFLKNLDPRNGSPAFALYNKLNRKPQTAAMLEGSVIDCVLLTPDAFADKYVVSDTAVNTESQDYKFVLAMEVLERKYGKGLEMDFVYFANVAHRWAKHSYKVDTCFSKWVGGEWNHLQMAAVDALSGKTVISRELFKKAVMISDRIWRSPVGAYLLDCEFQKELTWINKATGITCRGFADAIGPMGIIEVKTLGDANPTPWKVNRKLRDFYTPSQIAAYHEANGSRGNGFVLYISTKDPYYFQMYQLSDNDMEVGLDMFNGWCKTFKHVQANDLWHMGTGYYEEFVNENPTGIIETNCYQQKF